MLDNYFTLKFIYSLNDFPLASNIFLVGLKNLGYFTMLIATLCCFTVQNWNFPRGGRKRKEKKEKTREERGEKRKKRRKRKKEKVEKE